MSSFRPGITSFIANSQIPANTRVKYIGNNTVDVAAATDIDIGVTTNDRTYTKVGDAAPVKLLNEPGACWAVAAGAIADGAILYRAAAGQVGATGTERFGVALEAASAQGDTIEVLPFDKKTQGPSRFYTFVGSNGAGNIAIAGLLVGDVIDAVVDVTTPGTGSAASFTSPIANAGQLAQTDAANLSAKNLLLVVHTP